MDELRVALIWKAGASNLKEEPKTRRHPSFSFLSCQALKVGMMMMMTMMTLQLTRMMQQIGRMVPTTTKRQAKPGEKVGENGMQLIA